ncbi:MAG TPA: TetR/AcrR family transcriptional regulator [Friedmanniella sp.]
MPGTRERLVSASVDLMRSRGFRGTGLKDVITAAAATTGSLYHFFPGGKDELVRAAIRDDGAAHEATFSDVARRASGPGEAIATYFGLAADVVEATGFVDLCPIGTIAGETASTNDAIRVACDEVFRGWQRLVAAELVTAGFDPDDAAELAATTVATLLGGFVLVRTQRSGAPLRAAGRQLRALVEARLGRAGVGGDPLGTSVRP